MSEGAEGKGTFVKAEFDRQWALVEKDCPLVASIFTIMQAELYLMAARQSDGKKESEAYNLTWVHKLGPIAVEISKLFPDETQKTLEETAIRLSNCVTRFKGEMMRAQGDVDSELAAVNHFTSCTHP